MSYTIKRLPINETNWTAIVAPVQAQSVGILNRTDQDFIIRTDQNDDGTEDIIPAGVQEWIGAVGGQKGRMIRFAAGDTVCYLKAANSSTVAILRFLL